MSRLGDTDRSTRDTSRLSGATALQLRSASRGQLPPPISIHLASPLSSPLFRTPKFQRPVFFQRHSTHTTTKHLVGVTSAVDRRQPLPLHVLYLHPLKENISQQCLRQPVHSMASCDIGHGVARIPSKAALALPALRRRTKGTIITSEFRSS